MRRSLRPWFLGVSVVLSATACSSKKPTAIVISVSTEGRIPTEVNSLKVDVTRAGKDGFHETYVLPKDAPVPGTLSIDCKDSSDTSTPVAITVTAERDAQQSSIILRTATLGFVAEHTKLLKMPLRYSCLDFTTCASGQTCVGGTCTDPTVDETTLAEFDPDAPVYVIKGGGSCFDQDSCVASQKPVAVDGDAKSCGFAVPNGSFNIFMTWAAAADHPVVVEQDPKEGYTLNQGRASLAAGLCAALFPAQGASARALSVGVSTSCATKSPDAPICVDAADGGTPVVNLTPSAPDSTGAVISPGSFTGAPSFQVIDLGPPTSTQMAGIPGLPTGYVAAGDTYEFLPHGTVFSPAAQIRVHYTTSAPSLTLLQAEPNASAWTQVPSTTETGAQFLDASVSGFSYFVVVAPTSGGQGGAGGNGGNGGAGGVGGQAGKGGAGGSNGGQAGASGQGAQGGQAGQTTVGLGGFSGGGMAGQSGAAGASGVAGFGGSGGCIEGDSCSTGLPGVCAAGTCVNAKCVQAAKEGAEICDGLDNNCDGLIDNGPPWGDTTGQACVPSEAECGGLLTCVTKSQLCVLQPAPQFAEVCNGLDDDCNGQVDDNTVADPCKTEFPNASNVVGWTCETGSAGGAGGASGGGASGVCTISCASGWFDNDNSAANGCECNGDCPNDPSYEQGSVVFVQVDGGNDWFALIDSTDDSYVLAVDANRFASGAMFQDGTTGAYFAGAAQYGSSLVRLSGFDAGHTQIPGLTVATSSSTLPAGSVPRFFVDTLEQNQFAFVSADAKGPNQRIDSYTGATLGAVDGSVISGVATGAYVDFGGTVPVALYAFADETGQIRIYEQSSANIGTWTVAPGVPVVMANPSIPMFMPTGQSELLYVDPTGDICLLSTPDYTGMPWSRQCGLLTLPGSVKPNAVSFSGNDGNSNAGLYITWLNDDGAGSESTWVAASMGFPATSWIVTEIQGSAPGPVVPPFVIAQSGFNLTAVVYTYDTTSGLTQSTVHSMGTITHQLSITAPTTKGTVTGLSAGIIAPTPG